MIDIIWQNIELCVLVLLVSQGVIYYRLYLERLIVRDTLKRYKNRFKNNEYAIKSINKYIDEQAMQEYREHFDIPELTFYPSDEDRRTSQRRVSNKKGNKRLYDRRCK